jgi:hypothetical protein
MTNHKENVQLVIKPVIVVNNTNIYIPFGPIIPNNTNPSFNLTNLFENEDCDLLTMGGISISINQNNNNDQRFKQLGTSADNNYNDNTQNYNDNIQNNKNNSNNFFEIRRKFYR